MKQNKLKQLILNVLKQDERLWNEDKTELNQTLLLDLVEKIDEKIIELLLQEKELKEKFFIKINPPRQISSATPQEGNFMFVFKTNEFRFFMEENKIDNSYTTYKNRIGLTDGKKFLKDTNDVVLDFPYKDCVLEGGQSTEEGMDTYFEFDETVTKAQEKQGLKAGIYNQKTAKRKEIFFNQVLAYDEIDRLFDTKALTNWKRFTKDGEISLIDVCSKSEVDNSPLEGLGVDNSPLEGVGVDNLPKWQAKSLFPFWTLPKNKALVQRAKELRKQGILSEVLFWQTFKDKEKIRGYDIDRQAIIGSFIVDFFIAELGLVIEIDGSSHNDKQEYDKEREEFLLGLNLKVIRYEDSEVRNNIDGVYEDFLQNIEIRENELKNATTSNSMNLPLFKMKESTPCPLKRGKDGTIKENLIIKGNNLLALHSLKKQFAGKVKLIYIDPPYNTGNDGFKYNDNFNHSTWLTFMKNRLEVARELLRDDGVIFVQCDDNEQAYLKVLMDEVFGRENFINTISARMKNIAGASGGGEDKRLKKNIEFINIFAKQYNNAKLENVYEYTELSKLLKHYKTENISWKYTSVVIDYGEKEYLKSTKDGDGNEIKIYLRKNPIFKSVSQISKEESLSEKEVYYKYIDRIFTTAMPQSSIRTRVLEKIKDNQFDFISIEYIPRSGKNKGVMYEQFYKGDKLRLLTWLKDVIEIKNNVISKKDLQGTFWDGFNLNNLSKEGDTIFEAGKKPEELVKKVLDIATQPSDIILDYHLGSGTTCAVAHKMGRQYIGIEQMDYVETIAVERLKKVIGTSTPPSKDGTPQEGNYDKGGISKSVNWQGGGDFIYFELAKWNETAKEKIFSCKSLAELETFFAEMSEKYFLNYNLKIKEFQDKVIKEENFKNLTLDEQKKIFIAMLDNNQMYVNKTEMADKKFGISKEDQELTKMFYGGDK